MYILAQYVLSVELPVMFLSMGTSTNSAGPAHHFNSKTQNKNTQAQSHNCSPHELIQSILLFFEKPRETFLNYTEKATKYIVSTCTSCCELVRGTVEDSEVKRVNVEAGVVVVLEDVPRRVDVGARVRREAELGEVGDVGAIAHGPGQPEEPAGALRRLPRRHVLSVVVADVHDPAAAELLAPLRRRQQHSFLCHSTCILDAVHVARVCRCRLATGGGDGRRREQQQGEEEHRRELHGVDNWICLGGLDLDCPVTAATQRRILYKSHFQGVD